MAPPALVAAVAAPLPVLAHLLVLVHVPVGER